MYCLVFNENYIFPVAMRPGDTPVPIPNTMVKTWAADGTVLATVWESRWLPEFQKNQTRNTAIDIYRYQPGAQSAPEVYHLTLDFTGD